MRKHGDASQYLPSTRPWCHPKYSRWDTAAIVLHASLVEDSLDLTQRRYIDSKQKRLQTGKALVRTIHA